MTISLANAFKSVTEDEHWKKKVLIGGGLFFVILLLGVISGAAHNAIVTILTFALTVAILLLYTGFITSTANKMINSNSNQMAEWNENNLMLVGLKMICSWIVCCILLFLIFFVVSLILTLVVGIVGGIVLFLLSLILGGQNAIITVLSALVSISIGVVLGLYLAQFINAIFASYCTTLDFKDMIAFKKHFNIIKNNQHASWTLVGKNILYSLAFIAVVTILGLTIVGVVLIPFVYFAAYIVVTNLLAQYGREIEIGKYLQ